MTFTKTSFWVFILISQITVAQTSRRNCGSDILHFQQIDEDPAYKKNRSHIELHAKKYSQHTNSLRHFNEIIIPVVVHILYHTYDQNIHDSLIYSQIEILNKDFSEIRPNKYSQTGASKIRFALASSDPKGYKTNGITRDFTELEKFQSGSKIMYSFYGGKDPWPTKDYLNIWVANISGVLGYAYMPGSFHDGIVINYKYFGTHQKAPYNLGRTATHEIGHWLNLYHIWGLNTGCDHDDEVNDTPNSAEPNYGCKSEHSSCGSQDMVENFMDYGDDACMSLFTKGQVDRMEALFAKDGFRYSLTVSKGLLPGITLPCENGVQDSSETGIDCGGVCKPCITCNDGLQNGDETGIDCGGICPPCASCDDNIQNGKETNIDCGGDCKPCHCLSMGSYSQFDYMESIFLNDTISTTGQNQSYYKQNNKYFPLFDNAYNHLKIIPGEISKGVQEYYAIWIDFNRDGFFAGTDELVYNNYSVGNVVDSFKVKGKKAHGSDTLPMRIQMKWGENILTGCDTFEFGEVEDYSVILSAIESDPCTNGMLDEGETDIDCGPACTPCQINYCTSKSKNSKYEFIQSVQINGWTNHSGNNSGYADYTVSEVPTNLIDGLQLKLEAGFAGNYVLQEYWYIYIDWNHDGDFSDEYELMKKVSSFNKSLQMSLEIPKTITSGQFRMRIIMSDVNNSIPCGDYNYGETEDYTISILQTHARKPSVDPINITLYPNPASDYIHIRLNQNKAVPYTIFDPIGKVRSKGILSENLSKIACYQWTTGLYTISFKNASNEIVNKKILIQH